ncbi:MAG: glycosyltransferase family A protein [Verrucomicrobiota bacterium]
MLPLAVLAFLCALLPALLFAANLRLYLPPGPVTNPGEVQVSVLIPARNEAANIEEALASVLDAAEGVICEVIVLDDASTDQTAALVEATDDARVRLHAAPPLPEGWNGKQHACASLAALARFPLLLFLDADVRLAPGALAKLAVALGSADLLSGVPRQVTLTFSEKLLIPLIHFVLLGYLPIARMRHSPDPALGAGCGQLFLTTKAAYVQSGGHTAIRASLHDGLHLPRLYRTAGLRTDLTDLSGLAHCRMYSRNTDTWKGLAKNAHQGMGAPRVIGPMTVLLLLGQVIPWILLAAGTFHPLSGAVLAWSLAGALCGLGVRIAAAPRFQQSWFGALLHPLGVLGLLSIQWWAFLRQAFGFRSEWKGRRSM